jgi:predicted unusual protein kinase regulating ubiquinone biosynthesis (AarF/ABC1/UbiB family)
LLRAPLGNADGVGNDDRIPTGRVRRALPIAGLTARNAASRAAGKLRRSEDDQQQRLLKEAERYVAVLGDMKGVAMKLGQLLSFLDSGLVPEQYRPLYQQVLGVLQADAPAMAIATVHEIIAGELGRPVDELFAWFAPQPMAAASIGQVHAAHLHGGREVAVKVQYPGVAEAIAADLKNTELLANVMAMGARMLGPLRPQTDARVVAEEISERVAEELDYRQEAANQRDFADRYRGHPFIRIPEVIEELSTDRLLVMELDDGMRWTAALQEPRELRNTWAEVIDRFVWGALYEAGTFNADPHPGNYLFHPDGTVTFIDFGCVKRFTPVQVAGMRSIVTAMTSGDAPALLQAFVDMGMLDPKKAPDADRVFAWYLPLWDPVLGRQPWTFTPEFAAFVVGHNFDPMSEWGDVVRAFRVEKDFVFLSRIQLGLFSVLAALGATNDWHAIQDEIIHGAPPATDLGRQHAQWIRERAGS